MNRDITATLNFAYVRPWRLRRSRVALGFVPRGWVRYRIVAEVTAGRTRRVLMLRYAWTRWGANRLVEALRKAAAL